MRLFRLESKFLHFIQAAMTRYRQLLWKGMLCSVAFSLIAGTAIGCQTQSPLTNIPRSDATPSSPTPSVQASPTQELYRNNRLGFQFSYPKKNFVVDSSTKVPPTEPALIAAIEVWTQQHYQKIKAGAYEGGTEYPANVQVAIYRNSQKLGLQQWAQKSNRFAAPSGFQATTVAGRAGIAFRSSGLYEHEHVAFQSGDAQIILIALSKTGYGNNDATYRTAFDQIVRSFKML